VLDEIMIGDEFENALEEKIYVKCKYGDLKIRNLTAKSKELFQEGGRQESMRNRF